MHVEQVDFVSVPTRDRARAIAWYRDVLGLPVSAQGQAEVEAPGLTLCFWAPEEQGEKFVPNENGIAFRVADVEAAVEEARAAGSEVIGIEDTGVCRMGFVKDPDVMSSSCTAGTRPALRVCCCCRRSAFFEQVRLP